jgi:hypothetical protein
MAQATMTFPTVQGSDVHRAKCIISSKLPNNHLVFRVVHAPRGKRAPDVQSRDNEIVLMVDPKDNCVSNVPRFYGRIASAPERDDGSGPSSSEDELYEEDDEYYE